MVTVHCPAKINLYLAVTGVRSDGYHNLVSLVAPLSWGDTVSVSWEPDVPGEVVFTCSHPRLADAAENLAARAAMAFRREFGIQGLMRLHLEKSIPVEAGLGGGSSDAAGVLRALSSLLPKPPYPEQVLRLASSLGSDVPLFLQNGPCLIRGRGEQTSSLPPDAIAVLEGQPLLIVKPPFGVSTAWAYDSLRKSQPSLYCDEQEAEASLRFWLKAPAALLPPLYNTFQGPVFRKYLALGAFHKALPSPMQNRFLLSGSGSACFLWLDSRHGEEEANLAIELVRKLWGQNTEFYRTSIRRGEN